MICFENGLTVTIMLFILLQLNLKKVLFWIESIYATFSSGVNWDYSRNRNNSFKEFEGFGNRCINFVVLYLFHPKLNKNIFIVLSQMILRFVPDEGIFTNFVQIWTN